MLDTDLTCLEARAAIASHEPTDSGCSGAVELRESLSGTGTPIARCDGHWAARLAQHEEHLTRYPDSPHAPSWHDPSYAGESWDDDGW